MNIEEFSRMTDVSKSRKILESKIDYEVFNFIFNLEHDVASLSENIELTVDIDNIKDGLTYQEVKDMIIGKGIKNFKIIEKFEYGITTLDITIYNDDLINKFYNKGNKVYAK